MPTQPSPRGRLVTALIFGGLVLLGIVLLWLYYGERTDGPTAAPEAEPTSAYEAFGEVETLQAVAAVPVEQVATDADAYLGDVVTVRGSATRVCQMRGCWLALDAGEGESLRIDVPRDAAGSYVYTFPTDIVGREIVVQGRLERQIVPVETRRHLAEDDGATDEEVAAITEPAEQLQLTAVGALLGTAVPSPS